MKVFITGGTGLIGRTLVDRLLARGDQVKVLSRSAARASEAFGGKVEAVEGDPVKAGAWQAAIDGCEAVVNLAGEPVADKAWTDEQKKRIRASRIDVTKNLVDAIRVAKSRPTALVNASAVGIYGDAGDRELDESAPPGEDFLARVCYEWEEAAQEAESLGVRVVRLRIGVVLDKGGGALASMLLPFKLFAGGPLGSGRQWFPWIHRDDLVGLILFGLDRSDVSGPLNGSAPEVVTMRDFAKTLGRVLHRPSWMPVPAFVLKLGLGERSTFLLGSLRVTPKRPIALGYRFVYPGLEPALKEQLG